MKFINKVIVFIMGLVLIGIVTTSIGVVTQSENSVSFELLENNELSFNVYDKIIDYAIFDSNNDVTNFVSFSINGDSSEITTPWVDLSADEGYLVLTDYDDDDPEIRINNDNTYFSNLNVGDVITLTFELEQKTPTIIKTLLFLIPLVFSASLIGFLAFKKGEE